MEWAEALNRMLKYIEAHLEDELQIEMIAKEAHFSSFYLQRVFAVMTGMSIAEYIRGRRLSMAGQALQATDAKVLDVALRFGYDTPESFQKAFRRFHGITPSAAKRTRVQLKYLNPMQIEVILKGGGIMDYAIENIGELTIIGKAHTVEHDRAFERVPELWCEYGRQGLWEVNPGYLGICFSDGSDDGKAHCQAGDSDGKTFTYVIGCFADKEKDEAPEGFIKWTLPAQTWAKFRAVGPTPKAIQSTNRQIYTEWLPNNPDYELVSDCDKGEQGYMLPMNIEMYTEGDMDKDDYVSEIWIPVRKK